jgi:hypothetical protein
LVVVDTKNYAGFVAKNAILQIANYPSGHGATLGCRFAPGGSVSVVVSVEKPRTSVRLVRWKMSPDEVWFAGELLPSYKDFATCARHCRGAHRPVRQDDLRDSLALRYGDGDWTGDFLLSAAGSANIRAARQPRVHRELLAQHRGSRLVGDQVVFGGTVHTVVAISGTKIRLLSDAGEAGYR